MKIIIYWKTSKKDELNKIVTNSIEELWLADFIKIEQVSDDNTKKEFNIKEEPALIIEEESIDFKDLIFEGQVPPEDEIKSMLISIIWWDAWDSCAPSSCGTCSSASVCGI